MKTTTNNSHASHAPPPESVHAFYFCQGYGLVQFEEAAAVEKALALDGTSMVSISVEGLEDGGLVG